MRLSLELVDLRDAGAVAAAILGGADANLSARCRQGSIDRVGAAGLPAQGRLIATGDLHDNPLHLMRLVRAAGMESLGSSGAEPPTELPAHLVLHELIHGDRLVNGLDYSYRVLTRIAALKAAFPEHVHVLLANHELAQLTGSPVMKEGVRCNEAFDGALDAAFGDNADRVRVAVHAFIRSMPLGARFDGADAGSILCSHSLPAPELMERFDPGVLERGLADDDYQPRRGSAHLMVWGRGHTPAQVASLAERWGVSLFVLGHEKAEAGVEVLGPNAVVLNSDHERGVYWPIDLARGARAEEAGASVVGLARGG